MQRRGTMGNLLAELGKMADSPLFSGTSAFSHFDCCENGMAAAEIIEESYEKRIPLSALQKQSLLEYLKEYGHGDKDVYDAYANLLNQDSW